MSAFRLTAVVGISLVIAGSVSAFTALGGSSRTATVKVTLKEMQVASSAKSVPAGEVTFVIRNAGSVEHELVVLRHNGTRLPVKHFKAQENEDAVLGEAEDIKPGKTVRLTLTLEPGPYLLLCNVAGHYQLGMARILRAT